MLFAEHGHKEVIKAVEAAVIAGEAQERRWNICCAGKARPGMITRNLPFSKWEQIFKDPMVTAAAIDRLVHHGVILALTLKATGWRRP